LRQLRCLPGVEPVPPRTGAFDIGGAVVKKSVNMGKRRVLFELAAEPGSQVILAGSFNKWDSSAKVLKDKGGNGMFSTTLYLAPGRYEYKFIVNGQWCVDPECPDWAPNDQGSLNSVINVG
jgi:1,4-alpha-glucan branching enzyme